MNINLQKFIISAATIAFALAATTLVQAADKRYTLGSLAAGTTPFLVNTAWAKAVNKYVPGHKIQVSAVGAATKHQFLVMKGKNGLCNGCRCSKQVNGA
jgi:hypothetical protein